MIVTFCGHAQFLGTEELKKRMLALLEERVGGRSAQMYLGGYGAFDHFAYHCCREYKSVNPSVSLVFVAPYLTLDYQKNHLSYQQKIYDCTLYPPIEDKPKRYAILYRNRYMIEKADLVVAYVSHDWGGAYAAYKHAKRRGKEIFNLAAWEE